MKKNGLRNKKVLVMGLGLHGGGLATVRWLVKHDITDVHRIGMMVAKYYTGRLIVNNVIKP